MDILAGLNQRQKEAVEAISGPVLVVAGPGSGKTKTLTHRVAYLLSRGVLPSQILAVTFTNKAAEEIRKRVTKLLQGPIGGQLSTVNCPPIGTFHSICARLLRKEALTLGYTSDFTIYDEEDALALVKNAMKGLGLDQKQWSPPKIRALISSMKNSVLSSDEDDYPNPYLREAKRVRVTYETLLKAQNGMDFDDLLLKTAELFEENSGVLGKYQAQFHHILIDEFQDTNGLQYKIANMMAQKHRNLYCIGDMDQSIYSFRGADYRNILRFEKDWPNAKIITLEQNYRSTQNILDVADSVISQNTARHAKNLWTKNGTGDRIIARELADEREEGDFIISEIERLTAAASLRFKDFVVLYRTNSQSRAIEESFLRADLPYKIVGGIRFYQRKEIKDILAALRLCLNQNDAMAINRLHDIPTRFLISNFPAFAKASAGKQFQISKQTPKTKTQIIHALVEDFMGKSERLALPEFLQYIIKNTGFEEYVRDGTERGDERWDNVRELFSVALKYEGQTTGQAIRALVEEAALAQDTDKLEYEKDIVNLMTLHTAKGLEFPVVFIAGCEQGLLPHSKALGEGSEQLEEERRLCYVGITRAKERLYLLFARTRTLFGRMRSNPPSEFLQDIPERLIEFTPAEEEHAIELD